MGLSRSTSSGGREWSLSPKAGVGKWGITIRESFITKQSLTWIVPVPSRRSLNEQITVLLSPVELVQAAHTTRACKIDHIMQWRAAPPPLPSLNSPRQSHHDLRRLSGRPGRSYLPVPSQFHGVRHPLDLSNPRGPPFDARIYLLHGGL